MCVCVCVFLFVFGRHPDLWWEGGLPTDVADRVDASMPNWITEELAKRHTARIAEVDKYVYVYFYVSSFARRGDAHGVGAGSSSRT